MKVLQTGIEGLIELVPDKYKDHRGWFFEFHKNSAFKEIGINYSFTQDNVSYSSKNVIRGLHFQQEPHGQAKLVCVLKGKVLDVVVDLRRGSQTFGKVFSIILDSEKHNMLMVPNGFAHGFSALDDTMFFYKCSVEYNKQAENGIIWNDPDLAIDWKVENPIISDKDLKLPTFQELLRNSLISRD